MKKTIFLFVVAAILFALPSIIAAQQTKRIKFRKGATSAIVGGYLKGYDDRRVFVIRVWRGQTLRTAQIKTRNSARYVTVFVKNPAGETVGDADASCNNRKEIAPTAAGDYRIEVVECRKADRWRGNFKLKVTVE